MARRMFRSAVERDKTFLKLRAQEVAFSFRRAEKIAGESRVVSVTEFKFRGGNVVLFSFRHGNDSVLAFQVDGVYEKDAKGNPRLFSKSEAGYKDFLTCFDASLGAPIRTSP